MSSGPESLLPPLVAIALAILTRRVVVPLAAGVFVGAILLAGGDGIGPGASVGWWPALGIFWDTLANAVLEVSHLQALLFSLLLGAMVGVLESGGGMRALIQRIAKRIASRRGAQTMIASSGLMIFFDDYANTLLVGGTMRKSADRFGLSREKLAYLVDSTAAPVAGLSVVSTWAAIEISYMADGLRGAGIEDKSAAFEMFIQSIPYRFYPWLALVMVFLISITGRDFGPMRRVEADASGIGSTARASTDLPPGDGRDGESRWLWTAAVLPVLICLLAVGLVLVITGSKAMEPAQPEDSMLRRAGQILGNGDAYLALIYGGGVGLVSGLGMHLALGGCDRKTAASSALRGAGQMMPAILILWFAWALSSMTEPDQLDTGGYLASVLSARLDAWLLPTVVFLISGAIAFSTGTSWGTMAILTPLSISLALQLDPSGGPAGAIALSTCGAVLAGAIFGDHCSPISDTTVLSSRASGCDHMSHVRTQLPYAIVVAVVCVVAGTLPAAFGISPWFCLLAGTIALVGVVVRYGKEPA